MWDRYVGIPWVEKGRALAGCDCYGLAFLVYRDELAMELPGYSDHYVSTADRAALTALIRGEIWEQWSEIAEGREQPFDLVLIREGSEFSHIGIVVSPGRLLHVECGSTSVVESYRAGVLKHRIAGFYRHTQRV